MALPVQRNMIMDSGRHSAWHFYFQSDGISDYNNEVLIDPAYDFQPQNGPGGMNSVPVQGQSAPRQIFLGVDRLWWYCTSTGAVSGGPFCVLSFEQSASGAGPQKIITLDQAPGDSHTDWRDFGGVKDKTGIDGTGRLVFSSFGMTDHNAQATLVVYVKKYFFPVSAYGNAVDTLNYPGGTAGSGIPGGPPEVA
jgi:hypothetical protein